MGNPEAQQQKLAAGWSAVERGDPRAAEEIARAALREDGAQVDFLRLLGASLFFQNRWGEAIAPFREAFRKGRSAEDGYHLASCHLAVRDPGSAAEALEQVVRAFPQMGLAHNLLGISLVQQSRHREALACFAAAIEHAPQLPGVQSNMGNALMELGRHEEALAHFEKAVLLDAGDPRARNSLGNALFNLRRFDAAIASYRRATEIAPDDVTAQIGLAVALIEAKRYDEALACCRRALTLDPKDVDAHLNMGLAYRRLNRLDDAIASLERAIAFDPGHLASLMNLGAACQERGRLEEAAAHFEAVIALDPQSAEAHHNLGIALQGLRRHEEAIASFREGLKRDARHKYTLGALVWSELMTCRWDTLASEIAELRAAVRRGETLVEPFTLIATSEAPEEHRLCAARYCEDRVRRGQTRLWGGDRYRHERIRVAYLSADFREHAVAYCIAELLELHDRSKFEVIGGSLGVDDGSAIRARLARGFDRFIELRPAGDLEAAKQFRDAEVDIVVDLMGYTLNARPGILAHRPAPVQVGYLGYPGTSGTDFIDYLIADRFVIPEGDRRHYSEQVVYLPGTYMVNPSSRTVAPAPTRAQLGLPESGFVFCSFNNNYKITPEIFDIWMRLLSKVEGSVLWLARDNAAAEENLRKEAARRGVDPGRLVFAPFVKNIEEHYARYGIADLALDTAYNGHLTTADALWAGVPVLTWAGSAFAGRVAGSLLHAVGLPELVTPNLAEYEALALELARGNRLAEIRTRLARSRRSSSLFDTGRFRRHLESAYRRMWETSQRGEQPRSFTVEPIA